MKAVFKTFAPLGLALLALAVSCQTELSVTCSKTFSTFFASIENGGDTKVHLEPSGGVEWDENDGINIVGDSEYPDYFFYVDGRFKGPEISGTSFTAYYPTYFNKEGDLLVMRNAWPTPFVASKQCWGSLPMVARSEDNHLQFKQTLGLLHLRIPASPDNHKCNSIAVFGNNGEILCGEGYIDLSEDVPVYRLLPEGAITTKRLDYVDLEPFDLSNGMDVFFPMPETVLESGFTVSFEEKDVNIWRTIREVTVSTDKRVVIERGKMLSYTVDPSGKFEELEEQIERERDALVAIYNALGGPNWKHNDNWCTEAPLAEWYGVSVIDYHVAYLDLTNNNLVGQLPNDISVLSELIMLGLEHNPGITGPIPEGLYDCTKLLWLHLGVNGFTGQLSPKIGNLTELEMLTLYTTEVSGPLPKELAKLDKLEEIMLFWNQFSGKVPAEFKEWPIWDTFWPYIVEGNDLDISEAVPHIPEFELTTLSGDTYSSSRIRENELTLIFHWASYSTFSHDVARQLIPLYGKYKDKGFDILGITWEDYDVAYEFNVSSGWPWPSYKSTHTNCIGNINFPIDHTPALLAYDSTGTLVFNDILNHYEARENLSAFIRTWFGDDPGDEYESTDYSADGTVHVLQTATEGDGIDILMMGDAYSDRLIADGTYATVMNKAMEAFFAEEPYKSFRNRFNVRYVDVVSKNEVYNGDTALNTWYGEGTSVGGNNAKVLEYAGNALTSAGRSVDDALILVMMNRDYYAGTCYLTGINDGDYGRGYAIAYMPVSSVDDVFGETLRHEAGGHGFAKLADEYSYSGSIPQEELDGYRSQEPYGWWRNVDFTSDPVAVKWAQFIADDRYVSENIGVYEGACTYASGAFRPTQNSIMNDNTGGFNAPSRYAIWYRINKLSDGPEWTGTYEDFVTWDQAHLSAQAPARRSSKRTPEKPLPPLAPPVVIFNSLR